MINEITTVYTYALNGADTFLIPFEYLARKFVAVTLIGRDRKLLTLNADYTFLSPNKIVTNKVWTASDGYNFIEIRRYTSATEKLVNFIDGTILRSDDLNTSQIQVLHIAAEARDLSADTIGTNEEGNLDARGRRIANVADPVNDGDVVPLRVVRGWDNSALHSANSAKADADRAHNEADRSVIAANSSVAAQAAIEKIESHVQFLEGVTATNTKTVINSLSKASTAATEATNAANSAKADAEKAHNEANRAKVEADKLGNMNLLAGTINSIEAPTATYNGTIHWKSNLHTPEFIAEREFKLGYHWQGNSNSPSVRFYYGSNIGCGALIVNNNKTLSFTGMDEIIITCATNIDSVLAKRVTTTSGLSIEGGEFNNKSSSYLIADRKTAYNNGSSFRTHGLHLCNGADNHSQSSWFYLEDNGKRIAQVLTVQNGSTASEYTFGEQGLEASTPSITIKYNNKTTILQHDGNLMSTSGLWAGGYLSTHIATIQQDLTNQINSVKASCITSVEMGKQQTNSVDENPNRYVAPVGSVLVGIWFWNTQHRLATVYTRTLIITLGNGQKRIIGQEG